MLAQEIIDGMPNPPKIEEGRYVCPQYSPADDVIGMPNRNTFATEENFFKSLYHECSHYAAILIMPRYSRKSWGDRWKQFGFAA